MRVCTRCKIEKDESEYHLRSYNRGLQTQCKSCRSIISKIRYDKKKDYILDCTAKYRMKYKLRLIEKLGGKCVCCGTDNIYHLQFDHINNDGCKERKKYKQRGMGSNIMLAYLNGDEDISKLQLLCANCNHEKQLKRNPRFVKLVGRVV